MDIEIRRAEKRDIPRIGELLLQVHEVHRAGRPDLFTEGGRKYSDSQLEVLLEDQERPIFVALDETENVVGYGFCVILEADGQNLKKHRTLYIDDLCVDESVRRRHVGQLLFARIREYAREINCYDLTLNVWACNPSAMKFYERQGMQLLKKEMETILQENAGET
jgi:ribosomal protein S18 acetylase RimI-like enzyme